MKNTLLIASLAAALTLSATAQPNGAPSTDTDMSAKAARHFWTGVWQVKERDKPGVTVTLADDDNGALMGTIVFDIYKAQTREHIGTEPRAVGNPHLEGNNLAFEVRRILKPHLKSESQVEADAFDPTDIVEITLVPDTEGKATLNCPKCGPMAPTELVKAQ
jgi:hypothetical protein